jgi:sulfopyruvate decarboxylase subunit beta
MKRIEAIKEISSVLKDEFLITNLGFPSREMYSVSDRTKNFYMLGSMGLASSIGLGLALNCDKKIWVIDGDGSVLMNMGTFATIANHSPENFMLIILDDSSYGSTGCQPTYTSGKTNLARIAEGAGIESVCTIDAETLSVTLKDLREKGGPHVIVVKIEPGNAGVPIIPLTSREIKNRFVGEIKC